MTTDTEREGLIEQLRLAAKRMEGEPCLNDSGLLFKAADYIEQQFVALAELIEAGKEFAVCDSLDAQKRFKSALDLAAHQRISKACWNNHEDAGMNEEERDKGRMTTDTGRAELIALLKAEVAYKSGSEYDDYLLRALLRRTVAYIEQHPPVDAAVERDAFMREPWVAVALRAWKRDAEHRHHAGEIFAATEDAIWTEADRLLAQVTAALAARQQDDAVERNWQGEEGIASQQQESGS